MSICWERGSPEPLMGCDNSKEERLWSAAHPADECFSGTSDQSIHKLWARPTARWRRHAPGGVRGRQHRRLAAVEHRQRPAPPRAGRPPGRPEQPRRLRPDRSPVEPASGGSWAPPTTSWRAGALARGAISMAARSLSARQVPQPRRQSAEVAARQSGGLCSGRRQAPSTGKPLPAAGFSHRKPHGNRKRNCHVA